jgi:hypothetical protein
MAISRRSFLKSSAATAAVSLAGSAAAPVLGGTSTDMKPGPGNKWPGRVVVNYNKQAIAATKIDTSIAKKMIDDSIKLLTDMKTVGEAWKSIFPVITETTKIAIKVPCGCAVAAMAPHWSTVKAIIDGLLQMDLGGKKLPLANITIYDMNCKNNFATCDFTAANLPDVTIVYDKLGSGFTDGAKNLQYAKTLNGADYLINVFRPGGHWKDMGYFTLGFKNHYGTYTFDHSAGAQAYIRDINCTGVVYNKNVLSVCVGLNGAKENGQPGDKPSAYNYYVKASFDPAITDPTGNTSTDVAANTIIMSTDPISAEMQTVKLMRLNNKPAGKYGTADMPNYLKASAGISDALSDKTYNIGVIDELKMDIRRIINGEVASTGATAHGAQPIGATSHSRISAKHLRSQGIAFVEFSLPQSFIGTTALFQVHDIRGRFVKSICRRCVKPFRME